MVDAPFTHTLVERLAAARSVAVLTGAGISAESGLATFRDPDGLWQKFRPEELANVRAFLANPTLVQGWYAARRHAALAAEPNPGHLALAILEYLIPDFTLVTQNVDNLHQRAGSRNIVELHGNITRNYCIDCKVEAGEVDAGALAEGRPTACASCGGYIRPDVVWFGEMLPTDAFERAVAAARRADVVLSVGTSAVVYPAASIPMYAAQAYRAEVNIEPSAIAREMHEVVVGPAGRVLPRIVEAVAEARAGASA